MSILNKLCDAWDVQDDIASAWELMAQEHHSEEEPLTPIPDYLRDVRLEDLLHLFPKGFVVGPRGNLWIVDSVGQFDQFKGTRGTGTIIVSVITPEAVRRRLKHGMDV